jgi:hypothetical protein
MLDNTSNKINEAYKNTLNESGDWGSSDQSYMNAMIHKQMGKPKPKEMPSPFDPKFEAIVADAVDFHWSEWKEYNRDRDGLIKHAKKLYFRSYHAKTWAAFEKMFSKR